MNNTRYNVYIVDIKTKKACALIGKNLNEDKTSLRIMTGFSRIDPSLAFIDDVEVESEKNIKYLNDIACNR